ncbi:MAG: hypothetical protein U0835_27090 [Isosphaeraceae bacterium]
MLRLSLLGIGVIGFVYEKLLTSLPPQSRREAAASLILFGFAAGSALFHRYCNSETLRLYVWGLRFHSSGQPVEATRCLRIREWWVRACIGLKFVAAFCLAVGAFVLALAFTRGLL